MKVIGTNEEGDVLLQASRQEFIELERLCKAVEGQTISYATMYPPGDVGGFRFPFELGTVFSAVRAFYETYFQINELEELVKSLRSVVAKSKEEDSIWLTGDGAPPPGHGSFTPSDKDIERDTSGNS